MPSARADRSLRRWQAIQTAFLAVAVSLLAKHPDVYLSGSGDIVEGLLAVFAPWVALGCLVYAFGLTALDLAATDGAARDGADGADRTAGAGVDEEP